LPSFGQRSEEMDRQVGEIRAELALLRIRVAQWREKYGQALGAPMKKETVIGALSIWTVLLLAGGAMVAVVLLGKFPLVLLWVANVWRTARAAREIIVGVQEFKDEDAALTEKRALGAQLTKNTSATTKAAIKRIKKEEGV